MSRFAPPSSLVLPLVALLAAATPALAKDEPEADLRKRVGAWLRLTTPKKLTVLTKHPNPSRRVKNRGTTRTRIDRPYSKRVPRARSFSESRVASATWAFLAPSARAALGKAGKATLLERLTTDGAWKGRPVMLEEARIESVQLHRDRASVTIRGVPVEPKWCERTRNAKTTPHCPGIHDKGARHDRRARHAAFGFETKERLFFHQPTTFVTVWVREKGKFYRALKETSFGERLLTALPEQKGTESFARWADGGRAKGAKVADTGVVTKAVKRRVTIQTGTHTLVLVPGTGVTLPELSPGARVVFSGTFEVYQPPRPKTKRGQPKGRRPAAYVRGIGTVRPAK